MLDIFNLNVLHILGYNKSSGANPLRDFRRTVEPFIAETCFRIVHIFSMLELDSKADKCLALAQRNYCKL